MCCWQKSSSSSSTSAADVDVHSAWDNYDLILPVVRRLSDDRCSLLTQWTDSSASLKSCLSHSGMRRSLPDSGSTAAESDGGAYQRGDVAVWRRPEQRGRWRGLGSTSRRRVDSDRCSNHAPKRHCAESTDRPHDENTERRRKVSRSSSSSLWNDTGKRRSSWTTSVARHRRRTATHVTVRRASLNYQDDDDGYITTKSSENDEHPSSSTSSNAQSTDRVDHRSSLLSISSSSSSGASPSPSHSPPCHESSTEAVKPSLKHSRRHVVSSSAKGTKYSNSRPVTTSTDGDDLECGRWLKEIAVVSRSPGDRSKTAATDQTREDELRAARSLFEFRSSDQLRIANEFINGAFSLCSRRSLYNEQHVCPNSGPAHPTSTFKIYYSCSGKDFQSNIDGDAKQVIANNDKKSHFNDIAGNERCGHLMIANNNGNTHRSLSIADVRRDEKDAPDYWKGSEKECQQVEMIAKLDTATATISNEDDLNIFICQSPTTFNELLNDARSQTLNAEVPGANTCVQVDTVGGKHPEDITVSNRQDEESATGGKSGGLSTPSDWLASKSRLKTMSEGADSNALFSNELIQVFHALLVRSGVGETSTVSADIKMFPGSLITGLDNCTADQHFAGARKYFLDNTDSVATTITKPAEDDFESFASVTETSNKRKGFDKNTCLTETQRGSDMLTRLTPRLSMKQGMFLDSATASATDPMSSIVGETKVEASSPKQPTCYNKSTISTQTNDVSDELQPTEEKRTRKSRQSRGHGGKVRELIRLFESASSSTLDASSSPVDVKRATISAAVSVGELLRRANEHHATPSQRREFPLSSANVERSAVSSPDLTEAFNRPTIANRFGSECRAKAEETAVVHKSSVRWPTTARFRRRQPRQGRRNPRATPVGNRTVPLIVDNTSSETHEARLDDGTTTTTTKNAENLPQHNDNITNTLEEVTLSNKRKNEESVGLNTENRCQDVSGFHSANTMLSYERPEAQASQLAGFVTTCQSPPAVSFNGLQTVSHLIPLIPGEHQENVCHLSSSSSSSSLKSLQSCQVTVIASTRNFNQSIVGSGDVDRSDRDCRFESNYKSKRLVSAHFRDDVRPPTNDTLHGRPQLLRSVNFVDERTSDTSPEPTAETKYSSKDTRISTVARDIDYRRFTVQSWFIDGGPRQFDVPQWFLTSSKDVAAMVHRSKMITERPATALLVTETSCPAPYPVLRMAGVTVQLMNKVDTNSRYTDQRDGIETDDMFCGRPGTQSTEEKSRSSDVRAVKHDGSRTVNRSTNADEVSAVSASRRSELDVVGSRAATSTSALEDKSCDSLSPSRAVRCGSGDVERIAAEMTKRRRRKFATETRRTANDVVRLSEDVGRRFEARHDPSSKRPSFFMQSSDRAPSVASKCGLSGDAVQSLNSVTVVNSRLRSPSKKPATVKVAAPSQICGQTQPPFNDRYKRLAQQFLLTSLLEYRLDAQRK